MESKETILKPGKRLRIFVGESQEWQGKPLYRVILELAYNQGLAGATVLRGIEGFGPEHHLSSERLPDIADNLPVLIEIVDLEEHITRFLSSLDSVVQQGIMTLSSVEFVQRGLA